jgi:hypothetical protein
MVARDAMRYLNLSDKSLYLLVKKGRIRCTRVSPKGKRIFLVSELDRFLHKTNTTTPAKKAFDVLQAMLQPPASSEVSVLADVERPAQSAEELLERVMGQGKAPVPSKAQSPARPDVLEELLHPPKAQP